MPAVPGSHQGSPPLTRGILILSKKGLLVPRFTPAHAGNTQNEVLKTYLSQGSPPLTRGIRGYISRNPMATRFTPAHAGNTPNKICRSIDSRVHPRSRGEYRSFACPELPGPGSPPLTRGILLPLLFFCSFNGFTPAHAGNTEKSRI